MVETFINGQGQNVAVVDSLSFLADSSLKISWLQRHRLNSQYRKACRMADVIVTPDKTVAFDVERYYFIPKERIYISQEDGKYIPFE